MKLTQSQNDKKNQRKPAQTVAMCGIFIALAMIMSYIEHLIPFNFGIPGVKLGLANLCVMTCLYIMSPVSVLIVLVLRVLLSSLLFSGMSAFLYSLAGGLLSFLVMLLLKLTGKFSVLGVSVAGGVTHNIGQMLIAILVVKTPGIATYGIILIISGAITGAVIGAGAGPVIARLKN